MTVAAIILNDRPETAVEPIDGVARVRRLVDVAWSGGAVPIVVVCDDPNGAVAAALAGAPVTLAAPAPGASGLLGGIARGVDVAAAAVRDTDGLLIWPARMQWVDPETITSLIEAHGPLPSVLLRPVFDGEAGWPVLLPLALSNQLRDLAADRAPDELIDDLIAAGAPSRDVEVGDPGVTHDWSVGRADLPPFHGPAEPAAGHVHEWGSVAADRPDDAPLEGPALAPFGQAAAGKPDEPAS